MPGSITATSSIPTRYVFVPGPVITPGFGASTRRTIGLSADATPGTSGLGGGPSIVGSLTGARSSRHGQPGERVVDVVVSRDALERSPSGEDQFDGAGVVGGEHVDGPCPEAFGGLDLVWR